MAHTMAPEIAAARRAIRAALAIHIATWQAPTLDDVVQAHAAIVQAASALAGLAPRLDPYNRGTARGLAFLRPAMERLDGIGTEIGSVDPARSLARLNVARMDVSAAVNHFAFSVRWYGTQAA